MVKAKDEAYFENAFSNAQQKLRWMLVQDMHLEEKLEEFASNKHEYSQFCIDKMKGSRGFHGFALAE